jgi:hypothetical protein
MDVPPPDPNGRRCSILWGIAAIGRNIYRLFNMSLQIGTTNIQEWDHEKKIGTLRTSIDVNVGSGIFLIPAFCIGALVIVLKFALSPW